MSGAYTYSETIRNPYDMSRENVNTLSVTFEDNEVTRVQTNRDEGSILLPNGLNHMIFE